MSIVSNFGLDRMIKTTIVDNPVEILTDYFSNRSIEVC